MCEKLICNGHKANRNATTRSLRRPSPNILDKVDQGKTGQQKGQINDISDKANGTRQQYLVQGGHNGFY